MTTPLAILSLSGPSTDAIAAGLLQLPAFADVPAHVGVDNEDVTPTADWYARYAPSTRVTMTATWGRGSGHRVSLKTAGAIHGAAPGVLVTPDEVIPLLASLPVELAVGGWIHADEWIDLDYLGRSFSHGHVGHGWCCAFKGAGHDQLVSRRWLEYGPWKLTRGPGDLSFVQFHDLDAGAEQALNQAAPGHERMGISDTGGFIHREHRAEEDVGGLYVAGDRSLRVVIPAGEGVSQRQMLDACYARKVGGDDPARPIERVIYVFMNEADARAHLHELWLRELGCWAIVDGQEVALDDGYAPSPSPPEWVRGG